MDKRTPNAPFFENEHGNYERVEQQAVAKGYGKTLEEAHANARLIAAAPEMLAALRWAEEMILQHCKNEDGQTPDVEQIRAAIAKATGGAA